MTDELWKARYAVKRAVLDVVAFEYHDFEDAGDQFQADRLSDRLDEALKEYVEAYQAVELGKEAEAMRARLEEELRKPQIVTFYDPKSNYFIQEWSPL